MTDNVMPVSATAQPVDPNQPIIVPFKLPLERPVNCIISALEGGSGYWLRRYAYLHFDGREMEDKPEGYESPAYAEEKFWANGGRVRFTYDNPNEGDDLASKDVGLAEIISGLTIMAEKCGRHFGDLISENDDAETADVFIQCVIFGEIIYG